ncbi:heavy-metal-associated domain-containing protein [Methylovorus sp. SPW-M1]
MKSIVSLFFLAFALTSTQAMAVQTIKGNVNGMVCAFCAQGIEKKFHGMPQTKDVYVNLKQKLVAVELNDGQMISNETFKATIKDAGYEVTSIEMVAVPVSKMKSEQEDK